MNPGSFPVRRGDVPGFSVVGQECLRQSPDACRQQEVWQNGKVVNLIRRVIHHG